VLVRLSFCAQHIRDAHWVANDLVICTSGPGHINLVKVDNENKLTLRNTIKNIHTDLVREIAINKAQISQFASAGDLHVVARPL